MSYVDLNTVHNPSTGAVAPAAWGDGVRDNFEFLIDPPSCSVHQAGTIQTVATGTVTALTADTERFDNNGMHSTVSFTSRITAQTAGRYLVSTTQTFDVGSGTGVRGSDFFVNGTTVYAGSGIPAHATSTVAITTVRFVIMALGDYVEARTIQTSGGNIGVRLNDFTAIFLTR